MPAPELLLKKIRTELKKVAVPASAPIMRAYMKSEMPYHGVSSPAVKTVCKDVFADVEFKSRTDWEKLVRAIWHGAKFREERYCAIALTEHRRAFPFQIPAALKLYEEIIVTGAWWDYVDNVASRRVGRLLAEHPEPIAKKMRQWSRSSDLWKRRTAIICQLGAKDKTDLDLLLQCIEPSIESKEFFLKKGIGWALRQYARIDPAAVKKYVAKNEHRLSGLSRREALKHLR